MINKQWFLLAIIWSIFFSCGQKQTSVVSQSENIGEYIVHNIGNETLFIDGKGSDKNWKGANLLANFQYPWESVNPPKTHFKAVHNGKYLYFLFQVNDSNIHLAPTTGNDRMDALGSDRVELFFKKNDAMNPYYALEIDPTNRIFDSKGSHYRTFVEDWRFPRAHIDVASQIESSSYAVEGRISFSILEEYGLIQDDKIQTGVFRANYEGEGFKWISWIKPDSEKPDFHIPSAFGVFILEQ